MSFRVGVTYAGKVVILNEDGLRFDFSPETARDYADRLSAHLDRGDDLIFETCQAEQGRAFRYVGNRESAAQLVADLRSASDVGPRSPQPEEVA